MQHRPEGAGEQEHTDAQATTTNLIVFDLRTLARFRDDHPHIQVLSDLGSARVVLIAFRAGQQLAEHRSPGQVLMQVLRGRIIIETPEKHVRLQAGLLLRLEASVLHSVIARTDALMLLTITPDPARCAEEGLDILRGHTPLVARTM
jgi:quercetin dioxygenase-like cupin family protein